MPLEFDVGAAISCDVVHLLVATRNAHKTAEFAAQLGHEFVVSDLRTLPDAPEVEETGTTFEENAGLKAVAASRLTDLLVVADDSGLEVDALGGAPGIYSARYAGRNATDDENVSKLLHDLARADINADAPARFYCALALARQGSVEQTFAGEIRGRITGPPRGAHGFGYDPVFVPDGDTATLAELGETVKNRISHRARAVNELRRYLAARR